MFKAQEYINQGTNTSDSSDYFIGGITYKEVVGVDFNYKVTDESGLSSEEVKVQIDVLTNTAIPEVSVNNIPMISVVDSSPNTDGDNIVYEKGLTSINDNSEQNSGTFIITSIDKINSINIGNITITEEQLLNSGSSPISVDTQYGHLLIDGYNKDSGVVNYTYHISNTTDHILNDNEMVLDNIPLKVTDIDGDINETTLKISIVDDIVVSSNTTVSVDAVNSTTFNANVILTLDYSTSMNSTALSQQKDAAIALLNKYKTTLEDVDSGAVKVMIVKFGSKAQTAGWQTIDEAITYVNKGTPFSGTQYTNYDDALKVIINTYNSSEKVTADGTINTSYFMTDGTPTVSNITSSKNYDAESKDSTGDGIGTGAHSNNPFYATGTSATSTTYVGTNGEVGQGNWEGFLEANKIVSYAIGMGNNVSSKGLEPIAYNGVTGEQEHSTLLQPQVDFSELGNLLISIAPDAQPISNNLSINFGADGGYISLISIGGDTYRFDGMNITKPDNSQINGNNLEVTTTFGKFKINLLTGAYNYEPKEQILNSLESEVISFTAVDKDEDSSSGTLTIDLSSLMITQNAQLIDGIVEGVEYETSSGIIGITDVNGNFSYREGDSVTFKVGGVILGIVTAEDIATGQIFLQNIANVALTNLNDEYLENLATFLQSIDNDSGDNIVITQETRDALVNSYINLQTASEEEVKAFIESIGKTFVDEESAMQHVQEMLEQYAGIDASEFDEHIDDSIMTATLGNSSIPGIRYMTSAGLEGITDENGCFTFDKGDIISFMNSNGEIIAELDSENIGDDELITLNELGITLEDFVYETVSKEFLEVEENNSLLPELNTTENIQETETKESEKEENFVIEFENEEDIDLSTVILKSSDTLNNEIDSNEKIVELEEIIVEEEELTLNEELKNTIDIDTPSDWSNGGSTNVDGVNYKVYTGTGVNSTIKLLIEDDIDITPDI